MLYEFGSLQFAGVCDNGQSTSKGTVPYPQPAVNHTILMIDIFAHDIMTLILFRFIELLRMYTPYNDVVMSEMASQNTSVSIVCSTIYSGAG